MNFHVGQKVVCVDDSDNPNLMYGAARKHGLCTGTVYQVTAAYVLSDRPLVRVAGVEGGWYSSRFRPVKETNIDIFTAMLTPTPKQKVSA